MHRRQKVPNMLARWPRSLTRFAPNVLDGKLFFCSASGSLAWWLLFIHFFTTELTRDLFKSFLVRYRFAARLSFAYCVKIWTVIGLLWACRIYLLWDLGRVWVECFVHVEWWCQTCGRCHFCTVIFCVRSCSYLRQIEKIDPVNCNKTCNDESYISALDLAEAKNWSKKSSIFIKITKLMYFT